MVGCHFYNGLDGIRISNGPDSFPDLFDQNRKNVVWNARPVHPLPTSPLKGEGLKTS